MLMSALLAGWPVAVARASDHAAETPAPAEAPAATAPAAEVPAAPPGPPQPYQLVRSLNALQDQTGVGNRSAHLAQRSLIQRIGEEMAKSPAETWKDPRNGRALVSYVLSGGEPDNLKRLIDDKIEIGGIDLVLAAAAVAYAERRNDEARALLSKVDPRKIPSSLAAHVALVQGIVFSAREPEEAIKKFEFARLLAPGSLVEQGALRRQTMAASKLGRWDQAEKLAAQYLRRFGNAVYAPTFYRENAEQLAGEKDTRDEAQFARLTKLFDLIAETPRRQTYLFLAERAILGGKVKMARFAAEQASKLYPQDSPEGARLQVYGGAASVASDKVSDGLSALENVDRRRLGERDTLLADAAIEVGGDVLREPGVVANVIEPERQADLGKLSPNDASPVVGLAQKSIGKADELLGAAKK